MSPSATLSPFRTLPSPVRPTSPWTMAFSAAMTGMLIERNCGSRIAVALSTKSSLTREMGKVRPSTFTVSASCPEWKLTSPLAQSTCSGVTQSSTFVTAPPARIGAKMFATSPPASGTGSAPVYSGRGICTPVRAVIAGYSPTTTGGVSWYSW